MRIWPRRAPVEVQAEYAALAPRRGWRSALSSRQLFVLPDRVMRRAGGAAVMYRWTCIGESVLDAPPEVRRALLAHEAGHVAGGHSLAAMASLVLLAGYVSSPSPYVAIPVLGLLATLLRWLLNSRREQEADDYAAAAVGATQVRSALEWAAKRHAGSADDATLRRRIERLDRDFRPH